MSLFEAPIVTDKEVISSKRISRESSLARSFMRALRLNKTQMDANKDALVITSRLAKRDSELPQPPQIDFSMVAPDHSSLAAFSPMNGKRTDDKLILVPGLIGIESFDKARSKGDDAGQVLRLYCGVMLANLAVNQIYAFNPNFRKRFDRQFGLDGRPVGELFNFTETTERDRQNARRIFLARFAAGLALSSVFEPEQRPAMELVLDARYQHELASEMRDMEFGSALLYIKTNGEKFLPPEAEEERFPIEAYGHSRPIDSQIINTVLRGRLSRGD